MTPLLASEVIDEQLPAGMVPGTGLVETARGHRVVSGFYACSIGFQPWGDLLLAEADRLTA